MCPKKCDKKSSKVSYVASDYLLSTDKSTAGTNKFKPIPKPVNRATNLHQLNCLYMGDIVEVVDWLLVDRVFGKFGQIVNNKHYRKTNFAHIAYDNPESAIVAVRAYNGKHIDGLTIDGRTIRLSLAPDLKQRHAYNAMTMDDYRDVVNGAGECHWWRLGRQCTHGKRCPYYHIPRCRRIDKIPDSLNDDKLDSPEPSKSKHLSSEAKPKPVKSATNLHQLNCLYMGGIDDVVDRLIMERVFGEFGQIVYNKHHPNTNFAHIGYNNPESAIAALNSYNGKHIDGLTNTGGAIRLSLSPDFRQHHAYDTMTMDDYRDVVNGAGECHWWRLGRECPHGKRCRYKHIPRCRRIDKIPKSFKGLVL